MAASCDDSTGVIGIDIMPPHDAIATDDSIFHIPTQTIAASPDSIVANTNECFLGSIIDPETNIRTTCDYMAQFHINDNFSLPDFSRMKKGNDGKVHADSVTLTVYFDSYQGDSLAPMGLVVHELSTRTPLREDTTYSIHINPASFVEQGAAPLAIANYAVKDLSNPQHSSKYMSYISMKLPTAYGDRILQSYYDHPEYFTNSYQFTRNVCPGFYFQHSSGVGAMVHTYVSNLDVHYSFTQSDSLIKGYNRMASTGEVIQSARADNSPLSALLNQTDCTYLRSPAALFTEVTMPIDQIINEEHYTDSLNNARLSFRRINNQVASSYAVPTPSQVLLVSKAQMYQFFRDKKLADNTTSFLTSFNSKNNAYTFSDVSQLIMTMKRLRNIGAGITDSDNAATRRQKWATWEAAHPDWNKAVLIPVSTQSSTSTNAYGVSTTTIFSIDHQYGLSGVRLEGGSQSAVPPVELSVIYSRYAD